MTVTSLTCVQIWADKVCYAGDETPAKEGHLNGRVMLFCVVVQVSSFCRNCFVIISPVQQTQFANNGKLASNFVPPPTPTFNTTEAVN